MKIGIIGLGLIGGSLFKDLKKNYDVIAISKSQKTTRGSLAKASSIFYKKSEKAF